MVRKASSTVSAAVSARAFFCGFDPVTQRDYSHRKTLLVDGRVNLPPSSPSKSALAPSWRTTITPSCVLSPTSSPPGPIAKLHSALENAPTRRYLIISEWSADRPPETRYLRPPYVGAAVHKCCRRRPERGNTRRRDRTRCRAARGLQAVVHPGRTNAAADLPCTLDSIPPKL
jgi:hypothetical protein